MSDAKRGHTKQARMMCMLGGMVLGKKSWAVQWAELSTPKSAPQVLM